MQSAQLNAKIGKMISRKRLAAGWTQADLSLKTGIKRTSIAQIERGKQGILVDKLYTIAAALKCEITMLLPLIRNSNKMVTTSAEDMSKDTMDRVLKIVQSYE